jgi:UDP-MurNAc hydroxylase
MNETGRGRLRRRDVSKEGVQLAIGGCYRREMSYLCNPLPLDYTPCPTLLQTTDPQADGPREYSMKFAILSHAGLMVEHQGMRLICDPWLIGSCYWRSWWNFPEPDPSLIEDLKPNFIYLTHLHWDHFHGPSLKKLFHPDTTIIVPKVPTSRMIDDLHWLGFHNIVEVPHGGRIRLGADFALYSYQFGLAVDSAPVITGGGYTLFNCNDCKFFGLPLRQIMRDHPKIDFIFRSHSSASPFPYCVEDYARLFPGTELNNDSAEQFARCALYVGAHYAIPFASNHCFLHAETRHFNSTATTPDGAQRALAKLAAEHESKTQCVVMPPGSGWSDAGGFDIAHFDFTQREAYVEIMARRHAQKLQSQYEMESRASADFAAFKGHFDRVLRALPWILRKKFLRPVVFRLRESAGLRHWLVDPVNRALSEVDEAPPGMIVFESHATVLNDCAKHKMFSVWTASKRLKIHLPSAQELGQASLWMTVLDLYEVDLLPLHNNLSLRALGIRLRRWREPAEVLNLFFRRIILQERFSVSRLYPLTAPN